MIEPHWIVQFDCEESIVVKGCSREEAMSIRDDLDCKAVAVYSPDEVTVLDLWKRNGDLRVKYEIR